MSLSQVSNFKVLQNIHFWGESEEHDPVSHISVTLNLSGSYQVSISSGLIAFNISIIGTEVYSKRSQDLLLSLVYLLL